MNYKPRKNVLPKVFIFELVFVPKVSHIPFVHHKRAAKGMTARLASEWRHGTDALGGNDRSTSIACGRSFRTSWLRLDSEGVAHRQT